MMSFPALRLGLATVMAAAVTLAPAAQTQITPHKNSFSVEDDVKLGQQAAGEVRQQYPVLRDEMVGSYVDRLGRQLVAAIPPDLQQSAFQYSFEVVNLKEINAFALPGGPMFLNRGMLDAAKTDGEVAGVMAHEISHVVLRHGTAQATKGQKLQVGSVVGQILGAVVGGRTGSVIAQGSQFGLGAYFLKYGREYEREADLMGARIMSRAGYDPRQMAEMFRTIQKDSKSSGPEWLSDHPDPGNRYEAIIHESASLPVASDHTPLHELPTVQAKLGKLSPAVSSADAARAAQQRQRGEVRNANVRVDAPSASYRTYEPGNFMRISVPENWEQIGSGNTVTYAPEGGYVQTSDGHSAFTHGIELGIVGDNGGTLQQNTDQLLQSFARTNPDLRRQGGYRSTSIGGRPALSVTLTNVSEATGQNEAIALSTVQLPDRSLLFLIGVTPRDEAGTYGPAFAQIRQSIRFSEPR